MTRVTRGSSVKQLGLVQQGPDAQLNRQALTPQLGWLGWLVLEFQPEHYIIENRHFYSVNPLYMNGTLSIAMLNYQG